jgi:hypothetical protein
MVTVQVWVLPICVDRHQPPAIGSRSGPNIGAFRLCATMAAGAAVMEHAEQRVTTRPSVWAGAELISQPEAGALSCHRIYGELPHHCSAPASPTTATSHLFILLQLLHESLSTINKKMGPGGPCCQTHGQVIHKFQLVSRQARPPACPALLGSRPVSG